jgi:hypothetical protein
VGDVQKLSELMDRIAYDDDLYYRLKGQSKDSVKKFSQDIVFNQWLEVLH